MGINGGYFPAICRVCLLLSCLIAALINFCLMRLAFSPSLTSLMCFGINTSSRNISLRNRIMHKIAASAIPGGCYCAPNCFFTSSNRSLFYLNLRPAFCFSRVIAWLTTLNKMTSELNSVHLISAKHICPNSWLLESWVLVLNWKTLLGLSPYRACVS